PRRCHRPVAATCCSTTARIGTPSRSRRAKTRPSPRSCPPSSSTNRATCRTRPAPTAPRAGPATGTGCCCTTSTTSGACRRTAHRFTESPNLFTTDASFKELRKVSDANPQQAGIRWGTSEIVQYKNADGVPLTAALYKPENFDPHKQYPMLVYIYEKLTDRVNRYVEPRPMHSINITYYVSNGYLVLTPD